MVSKYYNIIFILILILILILSFTSTTEYKYKSLERSSCPIIEGAGPLDPTEYIQTNVKLLIDKPVKPLKKNWAATFTIELNRGKNGSWQQILGVSPSKNYEGRILGVWLCPDDNTIHIRTSTKDINGNVNTNDGILGDLDCRLKVPVRDTVRFDVVANDIGNGKQLVSTYMQNISKGEKSPTLIKSHNMNSSYYSPSNGFNEAWIFTTYQGYTKSNNIIDGTIKDLAFSTGDTPMTIINLQNASNYAEAVSRPKSGFTTMGGSQIEGYTNIGGIGNNGGIIGISPPTNSIPENAMAPAANYIPIKDDLGKDICTKSVVQPDDPKKSLDLIQNTGYNYPVDKGSDSYPGSGLDNTGTVPICSPDDLYIIQTRILKEINEFNAEYSDYMTYLYNSKHSEQGDSSKKLKYLSHRNLNNDSTKNSKFLKKDDSELNDASAAERYGTITRIQDLQPYKTVIQDIQTYNNLLKANRAYYPNPEQEPPNSRNPTDPLEKADPIMLGMKHDQIMNFRSDLDKKLFELNNVQNSAEGESKLQMDSSIYINLLWTTLATCVIYFMFV